MFGVGVVVMSARWEDCDQCRVSAYELQAYEMWGGVDDRFDGGGVGELPLFAARPLNRADIRCRIKIANEKEAGGLRAVGSVHRALRWKRIRRR